MLEINTLGGFSLSLDGRPVPDIGSRKAEAILVYLAVEDRPINRNVLKTLLWPESSEGHAATSLRVELSNLRKRLGAYLDISREAIMIRPNATVRLDLAELAAMLAAGRIDEALLTYAGDFLQGFYVRASTEFEHWLLWERECVRESLLHALSESVASEIRVGDYHRALHLSEQLLHHDPLDELAHRNRMLLFALDGKPAAALAQYEICRATLQEELGIEPAEETQLLHEQIRCGRTLPRPELRPALQALPAPLTSFVGRARETAQVAALIRDADCRLLTLIGAGGSGKSRLAIQVAAGSQRAFADGVCFVPLEACGSVDHLVSAIATALRFKVDPFASELDPRTQLLDYLSNRHLLLILDGFEHLVAGAALLSEILEHAPHVQVLVTSRQRLRLTGEWVLPVEGLPVPPATVDDPPDNVDSMQLFVERARQTDPDFEPDHDDRRHISHICRLVEGMPLAIELAASWVPVLSPEEIAGEVERSLSFLTSDARDIPDRHRSLETVLDRSWRMLTADQQELLSKLSVFPGSFDRPAASGVAGASLSQLSALVDRSLLRRDKSGRFAMHNLVRRFAAGKLSCQAAAQRDATERFGRHYLDLLVNRAPDFMGPGMLPARDEIQGEMDNVHAAVNWASLNWEAAAVRRVLCALQSFYIAHGWHEGRDAFAAIARRRQAALLAAGNGDALLDPVILSARSHQAFLQTNLGQNAESELLSRECLPGLDELHLCEELSECVHNLGVNASYRGEYEAARQLLQEAIRMGQACDHAVWPTYLLWLGHTCFLLGEYDEGLLTLREAYDRFDETGNLWGTAFALSKMGLAADGLGDHVQARQYHQAALSLFERIDNPAGQGYALSRLSMSAYFLEEYGEARRLGEQGYEISKEIGHRWGMATSLCRLGFAQLGLGELDGARSHFIEALLVSRREEMRPLSLYALAGVACTLQQSGQRTLARQLYQYVRQHPRTPTPYLEQAQRWMTGSDSPSLSDKVDPENEHEPVEKVVDRMLRHLGAET